MKFEKVLYKKERSNIEVYNDLNSELVNLFQTIRDNPDIFRFKAEWTLHSREAFLTALEANKTAKTIDRIDRALNYAILRMQSFAGDEHSWGYTVSGLKASSGLWSPFLKRLDQINKRLLNVQIEHLEYARVIKKYDTPTTLFYCDPPYLGAEKYYSVRPKVRELLIMNY